MFGLKLRLRGAFAVAAVIACGIAAISSATATSASNDELAAIKKAGVITIGVAQDPPFEFTTSSGKWTSFDPVLDQKLAAYLGVKAKFVTQVGPGIVAGLQSDKYDIIGADINATRRAREGHRIHQAVLPDRDVLLRAGGNSKKLELGRGPEQARA